MLLYLLAAAVGLAVLPKAADAFVLGAARLAAALRVSSVVIGAIVIGFGTSAPEMLVSAIASAQGKLDIAVGNIVGSNVANITLVLGVAALITPIVVDSRVLRREAPLSVAAVALFAVVVQGGVDRLEGIVLVAGLGGALVVILRQSAMGPDAELAGEVQEYVDAAHEHSLPVEGVRTVAGLAFTLGAAQALVYGASGIAEELGVGEGFIGLTLVALGTSLPELATAIQAARRGEEELIVGNLLGSNIFNSLAVGGIAGLAGPGPLDDPTLAGLATILMVVTVVGSAVFMLTERRIVRWEAVTLLGAYAVAVPLMAT